MAKKSRGGRMTAAKKRAAKAPGERFRQEAQGRPKDHEDVRAIPMICGIKEAVSRRPLF